jgi:hypothetical protein
MGSSIQEEKIIEMNGDYAPTVGKERKKAKEYLYMHIQQYF